MLVGFFPLAVHCANEASWIGYLVDRQTMKQAEEQPNVETFLSHYAKSIALTSAARSSGYALYSNGTWFLLDTKGNHIAEELIRHSIKDGGFHVMVRGDRQEQLIKVKSLADISVQEF
jgi:hypothetical protein